MSFTGLLCLSVVRYAGAKLAANYASFQPRDARIIAPPSDALPEPQHNRPTRVKHPHARADAHRHMIRPFSPTSNTERQRQFRKRNPGYYGRLKRRRRAELAPLVAAMQAEQAAAAAPARTEPLMLPAPVV